MEMLSSMLILFHEPSLILYTVVGVFLGMYAGALPGISVVMAVSLLVSFTFSWSLHPSLAMMIGAHIGGNYGGSRCAILINIPGTAPAAITAFDGYPCAQRGEVARALSTAATQSVLGGILGTIVMFTMTPIISNFALNFAPRDYFLLGLMGLMLVSSLSGESFAKGIFCGAVGLLIGCVGMDYATSLTRFTFGSIPLMTGINSTVAIIGLFGMAEALIQIRTVYKTTTVRQKIGRVVPLWKDVVKHIPLTLRTSSIGVFIGALPGTGGSIAALLAYDHAKKTVKNPEVPFGQGAIEGIIAPESADNASVEGAYIPMLTLGIPGDATTAVIIGALFVHGLRPGPLFMSTSPDVLGVICAAMLIGNIALLPVSFSGIRMFAKFCEIPKPILMPLIIVLCVIGTYAISYSVTDVGLMMAFGVLGYFMKKHNYPVSCVVLGAVLSSLVEQNLRKSIGLSNGSLGKWFGDMLTDPLSCVLFIILVTMMVTQTRIWKDHKGKLMFWKKQKVY
ncbi:C4-dicarboxylate ABC transporter permease [Candidatus Formimonas warabiya]|uniref:C4-dicarboxylate ABC transporter permease n=2 Tax=Formimonas warabiya TaxID=1761012 RepID=A0A3G1L0Z4_FORW1|nr:C4-dicarboxylate ABC transporter permease [Candidatus Formimonas warabiya]